MLSNDYLYTFDSTESIILSGLCIYLLQFKKPALNIKIPGVENFFHADMILTLLSIYTVCIRYSDYLGKVTLILNFNQFSIRTQ
jgi:hypothetical protein